jgi:predicted ester cyclase
MTPEENKALVRRFFAAIDAGDIEAMDEFVAEDYVDHHPPPFPGLPTGREGLKHAFRIFWEATPGRHEIEDQIAEGDKVVTRLTAYGRHEGTLPGPLPPTGADMEVTAVAIHRIAGGKIAEHWSDRDELRLMQQLGVISLPELSPE